MSNGKVYCLLAAFVVCIVLFALLAWKYPLPRQLAEQESLDSVYLPVKLGCEQAIENRLLAPSSVDFIDSQAVLRKAKDGYFFSIPLDAQNAFGAKLRKIAYCTVPLDLKTVEAHIYGEN